MWYESNQIKLNQIDSDNEKFPFFAKYPFNSGWIEWYEKDNLIDQQFRSIIIIKINWFAIRITFCRRFCSVYIFKS